MSKMQIIGAVLTVIGMGILLLVEVHGMDLTQGQKAQVYWLEYLLVLVVTGAGVKLIS